MNMHARQRSAAASAAPSSVAASAWWRGGVIYQIYPLSFFDSNGDGVGDLPGITSKLDYIADLGVDAIWLSPIFRSPMRDFGYDVTDYCAVDSVFGTLDDFDAMVARAHELGLRVLIDQVWAHTSDEHTWFDDSRASRAAEKADWYVWADPKSDGSPPNNWLSIFGGGAWTWEPRRRQYYLHHFLASQPQLNLYNPEVEHAVLRAAAFWLERGIDGFRLDAVDHMFHDRALRDNPARTDIDTVPVRPFGMQEHRYDMLQPETLAFMQRLRTFLSNYPGTVTLAEVSSEAGAYRRCVEYTDVDARRLDMAYSLALMKEPLTATRLREVLSEIAPAIGKGCICWAFSNHDVARAVTRWGNGDPSERLARALMALLLTLPGSTCLYQGEELGLTEAEIEHADMRDPYGLTFYPVFLGRDGSRTPMPWTQSDNLAGFTDASRPWLPLPSEHRVRSVDVQLQDDGSLLCAHRRFLRWRKTQPALVNGGFRLYDLLDPLFAFERFDAHQRILIVFNLENRPSRLARGLLPPCQPIVNEDFPFETAGDVVVLPPNGVLLAELE